MFSTVNIEETPMPALNKNLSWCPIKLLDSKS